MQRTLQIVVITIGAIIFLNWFVDYKINQYMHLLNQINGPSGRPIGPHGPIETPVIPPAQEISKTKETFVPMSTPEEIDDKETILSVAKKLAGEYHMTLNDDIPKYDFSKLDYNAPFSSQIIGTKRYGTLDGYYQTKYSEIQ